MGKRELSPLGMCVLGLVAERPMHPYEMHQLMLDRREDRLVKLRPGTLYHTVARMVEDGLLVESATERDGNRPERTIYTITDEGRASQQDWLRGRLGAIAEEYPEFPLAIAEAHNLDCAEVQSLLAGRIDALRDELGQYRDGLAATKRRNVPRLFVLDIEYNIHMLEAELRFLTGLIDDLPTMEWICGGEFTKSVRGSHDH